jgi:hypothetical protein
MEKKARERLMGRSRSSSIRKSMDSSHSRDELKDSEANRSVKSRSKAADSFDQLLEVKDSEEFSGAVEDNQTSLFDDRYKDDGSVPPLAGPTTRPSAGSYSLLLSHQTPPTHYEDSSPVKERRLSSLDLGSENSQSGHPRRSPDRKEPPVSPHEAVREEVKPWDSLGVSALTDEPSDASSPRQTPVPVNKKVPLTLEVSVESLESETSAPDPRQGPLSSGEGADHNVDDFGSHRSVRMREAEY